VVAKPHLSAWQVSNICIGAFGIQFGFALPQANATRIFQNLGASLDSVPLLWLAGPITGLIVQPLVGYYSDRTWTRFGRRRPYFLAGAALAAAALVAMPSVTTLWMAVLMLWLLDASLNLTMGPYRAFVADELAAEQRSSGYLTYMSFLSVGAVIGSLMPWAFDKLGVSADASAHHVSHVVRFAFYVGAALLFTAVCWSAFTTREYAPETLEEFDEPDADPPIARSPSLMLRHARAWLLAGAVGLLAAWFWSVRPALYVLVIGCLAYGISLLMAGRMRRQNAFTAIIGDMESMSPAMRWLAVVQFCSWFALFGLFMYAAPAVARSHFGAASPGSPQYEAGANWTGVLFATLYGLAALVAALIPYLVRRFGMPKTHRFCLWTGAAGLLSMMWIHEPEWLLVSMAGLGVAWASIVSLPYAMLANHLPTRKMGVNIGIFNIFIVIPQLLAIGVMSTLLDLLGDGDPSHAFGIGAVAWLLAGWVVTRVPDTAR
jgi:maltose/moltooligosaccharide transporter